MSDLAPWVIGTIYVIFHRPIHRWFDQWAEKFLGGADDEL